MHATSRKRGIIKENKNMTMLYAPQPERIASCSTVLTSSPLEVPHTNASRSNPKLGQSELGQLPLAWRFASGVMLSTTHMLDVQTRRFSTTGNVWEADEELLWKNAFEAAKRVQKKANCQERRAASFRPECGGLVIDGGAALGYYTLLSMLHAPRGTTIHAFNPHPVFMRALRDNLVLNRADGSVCLHERALSSVPDDRVSFGFGYGAGIDARDGRASHKEVIVRTTTLDAWAAAYLPALPPRAVESAVATRSASHPPFLLVKLDIEGAADKALAAASTLIGRATHWFIGIHNNRELHAAKQAIKPPLYTVLANGRNGKGKGSPNGMFVARLTAFPV